MYLWLFQIYMYRGGGGLLLNKNVCMVGVTSNLWAKDRLVVVGGGG